MSSERFQRGDRVALRDYPDTVGTLVALGGVIIWDNWPRGDMYLFDAEELTLAPRQGVSERVLRYWEWDLTRREANAERLGQ
jgi:hypothetical protein